MDTQPDPISQGILRCLDFRRPDDAAELEVWEAVMNYEEGKGSINQVVTKHRIYKAVCERMGVKALHLDEFLTD